MIRRRGSDFPRRRWALFPPGAVMHPSAAVDWRRESRGSDCKGKLYSAQEARKLGLVDGVAPRDKLLELARKKLRDGKRKLEGRAPARPGVAGAPPSKTTRKRRTRTCL